MLQNQGYHINRLRYWIFNVCRRHNLFFHIFSAKFQTFDSLHSSLVRWLVEKIANKFRRMKIKEWCSLKRRNSWELSFNCKCWVIFSQNHHVINYWSSGDKENSTLRDRWVNNYYRCFNYKNELFIIWAPITNSACSVSWKLVYFICTRGNVYVCIWAKKKLMWNLRTDENRFEIKLYIVYTRLRPRHATLRV